MNPAAAGGPVGGTMMMMNNGSPATQANNAQSPDTVRLNLNTYIYEYCLKVKHYDIARQLVKDEKFEIRYKTKSSPGNRKDSDMNGDAGDLMDMDQKDDVPDDLPRPDCGDTGQGSGFLFEWFSVFSDLFTAHRSQGKTNGQMTAASQYVSQHLYNQRIRESQQNQNLRPGPMSSNMMRSMRNNMMNGDMARSMAPKMTPQQVQAFQNKQAQMLQQSQMQRGDQAEGEMNGRPGTPAEGDNGGSPSKRPRLDAQQQFNNGMMAGARPGMPAMTNQGMMIQAGFQPNVNQAQFRPNGQMSQKAMQGGMPNGMMAMGGNAGSPLMQGMNGFPESLAMEYQQSRMPAQGIPGAPGAQSGNHALQDYQMQLMLLEQQNKKRLMMARQEQHENTNPREGGSMPAGVMQPGMSPSGSRGGTSPNPADQMKRTPQIGGLPGSPSAGDAMQGRSPAPMGFMNGMQPQDFHAPMFMKNEPGMMVGPGGPGMRPPTSADMNAMTRQQQQARMGGQFPHGPQPMTQQPSQGQPQAMNTPGQKSEMPPPQAPAGGNGPQRNQPASPAASNGHPTPSQANKPNPKSKKGKDEPNRKRPTKKNSTANAPAAEENAPATSQPSTPITPSFNQPPGKGQAPGVPQANQPPNAAQMGGQPQMPPGNLDSSGFAADFGAGDQNFNLDFSTLENADVLENFDFDSFLNTSADDAFNFDTGISVDASSLEFGPGDG